jgi:hypothetical protein
MLFIHGALAACTEGDLELVYDAGPNAEGTPLWVPVCGCGWRGQPRYFRGYAMNQLREHHATGRDEAPADRSQPAPEEVGELRRAS